MLQLQKWKACLQLLFLDVLRVQHHQQQGYGLFQGWWTQYEDALINPEGRAVGVHGVEPGGQTPVTTAAEGEQNWTPALSIPLIPAWLETLLARRLPVLHSVVSQTAFSVGCVPSNTDTGVWFERLQWRTSNMPLRKKHGNQWSSAAVSLRLPPCTGHRHRALNFCGKAS